MAKATTAKKTSNKPLSKSAILQAITDSVGEDISRKHVKQVIETLVTVGHRELKKTGIFVLPGFAKFVVVKKPARPAREGINPFTKERQKFAAKPASKGVRARPVKAVKDAVILIPPARMSGRSSPCTPRCLPSRWPMTSCLMPSRSTTTDASRASRGGRAIQFTNRGRSSVSTTTSIPRTSWKK